MGVKTRFWAIFVVDRCRVDFVVEFCRFVLRLTRFQSYRILPKIPKKVEFAPRGTHVFRHGIGFSIRLPTESIVEAYPRIPHGWNFLGNVMVSLKSTTHDSTQ